MKNHIFLIFLFFVGAIYGQKNTSIRGEIIDKSTAKPIPYATVLLKKENGSFEKGVITNDAGVFKFDNIDEDNYTLNVEFIGYQSYQQNISANKAIVKVETIFLEENIEQLQDVVITAEKSTIEQKIDKKIVNVGKDLIAQGPSAIDLMNNLPAVNVTSDGSVTYRGSENIRVMIDGKLSNLENASEVLEQIPSNSIQKIELISNPSAKYSPDGLNGIINIITKKSSFKGWNLKLNSGATIAKRERFNGGVSLNYKPGATNFYLEYATRFGDQITDGQLNRFDLNSSQITRNVNNRKINNFKTGVDFSFSEKNTLSLFTAQNFFTALLDGNKSLVFSESPENNYVQDDLADVNNVTQRYNVDYKHTFDESDHFFEVEVDYNFLKAEIDNTFEYSNIDILEDYEEAIKNDRKVLIANLDYVKPFSKNNKLELGFESRINTIKYNYNVSATNLNNAVVNYDRDILSSYLLWSTHFGKFSLNAGSRFEYYNVEASFNQENLESDRFNQQLFNVFPSVFLKYQASEKSPHQYQFSYGRRIERPSFRQINPLRQFTTPQIVATGNLFLTPQFSNSAEFNYLYNFTKGSLSFGTFYKHVKDEIARNGIFDQDDPNLLRISYDNFKSNNAFGAELGLNIKPINWWRINANLELYDRRQSGIIEGEDVSVQNTVTNLKLTNNFTLTKNLKATLFGFYSGRQEVLQYELKSNYYINTGLRYSFSKGKGSFSLNFNDVLGTRRFAFETYRTVFQEGEFLGDTQQVYFGLSYRFGGKLKTTKRKKRDSNIKADKFL